MHVRYSKVEEEEEEEAVTPCTRNCFAMNGWLSKA
jgi:hypothetical protein